jgi:hypothetical protein
MATVTTTTVSGYAHCRNPRCAGTEQQPVDALCHTSAWTYVENGGNMPGVERSTELYVFADERTDSPCPVCGDSREVSAAPRPQYTPLSGHRQDGLLHVKQYNAQAQPDAGNGAIVAQLMEQVAALSAQIAGRAVPAQDTAPADDPGDGGATPKRLTTGADDTSDVDPRLAALHKARAVRAAAKGGE